ncbi:hypothetical protein BC941DRAFT_477473 [Chlamydoabsidia padenii]|nr:hypothetical protein BC941DRAFT_477473 [Chlamydoabsidia padenii]
MSQANFTFVDESANFDREVPAAAPPAAAAPAATAPPAPASAPATEVNRRGRARWTDARLLQLTTSYYELAPYAAAHGTVTTVWEQITTRVNMVDSDDMGGFSRDSIKRKVQRLYDQYSPSFEQGLNDTMTGVNLVRGPLEEMVYQCWSAEREVNRVSTEQRHAEAARLEMSRALDRQVIAAATYARPLVDHPFVGEPSTNARSARRASPSVPAPSSPSSPLPSETRPTITPPWAAMNRLQERIDQGYDEMRQEQREHNQRVLTMVEAGMDRLGRMATVMTDHLQQSRDNQAAILESNRMVLESHQQIMQSHQQIMRLLMAQNHPPHHPHQYHQPPTPTPNPTSMPTPSIRPFQPPPPTRNQSFDHQ